MDQAIRVRVIVTIRKNGRFCAPDCPRALDDHCGLFVKERDYEWATSADAESGYLCLPECFKLEGDDEIS